MIPILYSSSSVTEGSVPTSYGIGALTDCIRYEVQEERNGKYEMTLVYPANGIYNLSGQRVNATYKGIVIKNGEKVYNK